MVLIPLLSVTYNLYKMNLMTSNKLKQNEFESLYNFTFVFY